MKDKILNRLFEEGQKFEEKNKTVPYNQVFYVFIVQSIIDAVRYYFEQDDVEEQECVKKYMFREMTNEQLKKVLDYDGSLINLVKESWLCFRHRDQYDVFGLDECEGWYGTIQVINEVFRFWL